MPANRQKEIMDKFEMDRILTRMAHEIMEKNNGAGDLHLVGIRTRGVPLAKRLSGKFEEFEGTRVPVGILDITLYRDDLQRIGPHPVVHRTELPSDIDDCRMILVDDVLFTGRTARAALDALMDLGRPKLIQLAALIDRGHRELPIHADYIGKNLPTSKTEVVDVLLEEVDGQDRVLIREKHGG